MGNTWKTVEQTAFLEGHTARYFHSVDAGNLKDFWAKLATEWFEQFPLEPPSSELIEKEGTKEKAISAAKAKKLKVSGVSRL